MTRTLAVIGFLLGLFICTSPGQLAITEVMSEAALESNPGFNRPDFWELTNFGTNDIDLDGYGFSDSRRTDAVVTEPFNNLVIHPGESILFFRLETQHSSVTNEQRFRDWWGDFNLPANLQIRTYPAPGLDGDDRDELWVYDRNLNVVDYVFFGEARTGRSFIADSDSGLFGVFSRLGIDNAVAAVLGGDIGSPGTAYGPIDLRWIEYPASQTVDFGSDATFTAGALGLPRPKYQWLANGVAIPGANSASLTITNATLLDAKRYSVRITNGISSFISQEAVLTVNTNPAAPWIIRAPGDLTIFTNQTAIFSVRARGFPALQYQWQSNGIDIAGARLPSLSVTGLNLSMSGTRYSVRIWNTQGSTNVSALLTVTRRPNLRITEVMANPIYGDSSGHYDWFELTNFDTNSVNLKGYRFFDWPSFVGAFTISTPLVIQPGESIVFVEQMYPEQFWNWWGIDYSRGVQVCTYHGFSLSEVGEQIYLWNGAATDPLDPITTTTWGLATRGVTMECTEWFEDIWECNVDSVPGSNGAFFASLNGDVGSPGYIRNPPPRILELYRNGLDLLLRCRVLPGKTYRLSYSATLPVTTWTSLGTYPANDFILEIATRNASGRTGFYHLEETP